MSATLAILLTGWNVAAPLLAHAGHGVTDPNSPEHQVLEPVHAATWLAVGVALAVLTFAIVQFRRRQAIRVRRHEPQRDERRPA